MNLSDFGGGAGVPDNTPALNAAISDAQSSGDITLELPHGDYAFLSCPNPMPVGFLKGAGIAATVLTKKFSGGNFLCFTGAGGWNGAGVRDLSLYAAAGYAPGNAIAFVGDAAHQPDYGQLENVNVTGPGLWSICLYLDGVARTSPQGVRDFACRNLRLFNAATATVWLRNVVGFTMEASGVFPGAGPASACGIWVTGGGSPLTNSTDVDFADVTNNGVLNLTNLSGLSYVGGEIGSLATDGSSHCRIDTRCSGPVANNLTQSTVNLI